MELRHIRYFVAVAEELHMGRAARRLNMSQPPLSMQIAALEGELKLKLFSRLNRRLSLTLAGSEFLRHAYHVLDDVSLAAASAQRVQSGESGSLDVGFVAAMSYSYLPAVLKAYQATFPDVALVLHEMAGTQQQGALRTGRLDIGFLRPPIVSDQMHSEVVLRESYLVAFPADHRLFADPISPAVLQDERFVMMKQRQGWRVRDQSMELCLNAGFTPKIGQETLELHTMIGLVSGGLGVAIVPASARFLGIGGVRYATLAPDILSPEAEIAMVWRGDDESPQVRNFRAVTTRVMGPHAQPRARSAAATAIAAASRPAQRKAKR